MHVVHLYDGHEKVHRGRGSVPGVVWNLCRETVGAGHEVTVIERRWRGLETVATHEGVGFHRLDLTTGSREPWADLPYEMVSDPVGAARLLLDRTNFAMTAHRPLKHYDPDVIHVHVPFAANVLATLSGWVRDRLVYTAHLGETENRVVEPRFSPDVHLAKRSARTIVLNPSMRRAFAERGVPDERLALIPNGIDLAQFEHVGPQDRRTVRTDYVLHGDVTVLFVGTVTPRKGALELVEAASRALPIDGIDAEIVIVGKTDLDPEYVNRVRARIADADLDDHVTFTGFVSEEELDALYTAADIAVLPSFEEGSSVTVSEALAAGLPVLGSRIDGIRQRIDHGTHGLLVEPGDVSELAEGLRTLLSDATLRESMRSAVRERAEEYAWDRVTRDVLDVYREVAT